jgi:hypothetical protein
VLQAASSRPRASSCRQAIALGASGGSAWRRSFPSASSSSVLPTPNQLCPARSLQAGRAELSFQGEPDSTFSQRPAAPGRSTYRPSSATSQELPSAPKVIVLTFSEDDPLPIGCSAKRAGPSPARRSSSRRARPAPLVATKSRPCASSATEFTSCAPSPSAAP